MSWIAVGVAGTALVTSTLNNQAQKKQQERAANISAAQEQFSPWTHQTPQQFNPAATQSTAGAALGGAMQGGLAGVMTKQGMQNTDNAQKLNDAQVDYYKSKTAMGGAPTLNQPTLMPASQPAMDPNYFNKPNPYGS